MRYLKLKTKNYMNKKNIGLIFNKILQLNKQYFVFLMKLDLKIIWFFSETVIGYCFYLFCVIYGIAGCSGDNCGVSNGLAIMFAIFVFGLVIQAYILVKFLPTRKLLENLIGRNYIIDHLGEYSGTSALMKLAKYGTPFIGVAITEASTKYQDNLMNQQNANIYQQSNLDAYKQSGHPLDYKSKEFKEIMHKANELRAKPPKGLCTRGLEHATYDNTIEKITGIFSKKN